MLSHSPGANWPALVQFCGLGNTFSVAISRKKKKIIILGNIFSAKSKPLPAAIRKKRINFRLRKLLSPKSPLMVVNEMVGSVTYNFIDAPAGGGMAPGIPHLFTAQCVVSHHKTCRISVSGIELKISLNRTFLIFSLHNVW